MTQITVILDQYRINQNKEYDLHLARRFGGMRLSFEYVTHGKAANWEINSVCEASTDTV